MSSYLMYENGLNAMANVLDDIAKAQSDKYAREMNELLAREMDGVYQKEAQAELNKKMAVRDGIDTKIQDLNRQIYELQQEAGEKFYIENPIGVEYTQQQLEKEEAEKKYEQAKKDAEKAKQAVEEACKEEEKRKQREAEARTEEERKRAEEERKKAEEAKKQAEDNLKLANDDLKETEKLCDEIDKKVEDLDKRIKELQNENTTATTTVIDRVESHIDTTSTQIYDDNVVNIEAEHRQCKTVDISTGKEVFSQVYNLSDETVQRQMEVENQLHTQSLREMGMGTGYNTEEYKENTGISYYNKRPDDIQNQIVSATKAIAEAELTMQSASETVESLKGDLQAKDNDIYAVKLQMETDRAKNNEAYMEKLKADLGKLESERIPLANNYQFQKDRYAEAEKEKAQLEDRVNNLTSEYEKETDGKHIPKTVYIQTADGVFKFTGYGYKDVKQSDGTIIKEYQKGEWVKTHNLDEVTHDINYNKTQTHWTKEKRDELKELFKQRSEALDQKKEVTKQIYDSGGRIIKDKETGKEQVQVTNKALKLSFDTRKELRKFVFDMQAKGITVVTLNDKTNHQYMVMVPDNRQTKEMLNKYGAEQNMRIRQYRGYDLSGKTIDNAMLDGGKFFTSTIRQELYHTDAGQTVRKVRQVKSIARDFLNRKKGGSTFDRRHYGWNALEDAIVSINAGTTPLADKKYKDMLSIYDPITHKKTGEMGTEQVLKFVNDRYAKPNGKDIIGNFTPNKLVTAGWVSKNKKDLIEIKKNILMKYTQSGVIRLDKHGNVDRNALFALKQGKSNKDRALELPTDEEINFLLMTTDTNRSKFSGLTSTASQIIRMSGAGSMYEVQRIYTRTKQVIKITKAGKKLVGNGVTKFKVVRLKHKVKDPVAFEEARKKLLEKEKLKKINSSKVKQPNAISRHKQKKRVKKAARKDKKREWMANTFMGKAHFKLNSVKSNIKQWASHTMIGRITLGIQDFTQKFKKFLIKKLAVPGIAVLAGAMIAIGMCMMISAILSAIASFFEADSPQETMIYKIYEALAEEEEDWIDDCNDMDGLWSKRLKLKYGEPTSPETHQYIYQDWNTYVQTLTLKDYTGENEYTTNGASIVVDKNGDLYINPFGVPVIKDADGKITSDKDRLVEIDEFDEANSKFQIIPYGTTTHNSNVKDILCMTEVMYNMAVGPSGESWLEQSATDSKFTYNAKNVLNDIGNLFKAIGDWFSGEDTSEDRYETASFGTTKNYAIGLFEASHQESITLVPRILPLKGTGVSDKYCCPVDDGCCEGEFFINDDGSISVELNGPALGGVGINAPTVRLTDEDDYCDLTTFRHYHSGDANYTYETEFDFADDTGCWDEVDVDDWSSGWQNYGSAYTYSIGCPDDYEEQYYECDTHEAIHKTTEYEFRVVSGTSIPTSEPTPTPTSIVNASRASENHNPNTPTPPQMPMRPTPTERPREQTLASSGSSGTNTPTPAPTNTSTPTPTPEPTNTPTPTPTPITYYQVQMKKTIKTEKLVHNCDGDHEAKFCGGHISVEMYGMVYGISNEYLGLDEGNIPAEKSQKYDRSMNIWDNKYMNNLNIILTDKAIEQFGNGSGSGTAAPMSAQQQEDSEDGWSWWWTIDNSQFQTKLELCDDIFDIDLAIDYGETMFPVKGHKVWNYEAWSGDNLNLAVMKFKANWMDLYGFDIPINFGISPLNNADISKIITALEETYGDRFTDTRHDPIQLALSCVGNGMYNMEHHGHAYLWTHCQITGATHCNITDCSGFCSYVYLNFNKLAYICATPDLATYSGLTTARQVSNLNNALPGDMIVKVSVDNNGRLISTSEGGSSHALIYIGTLNQDVELSNGNILYANCPITVDCLGFDDIDYGCGNIYLRVHTSDTSKQLPGIGASGYVYNPSGLDSTHRLYLRSFE